MKISQWTCTNDEVCGIQFVDHNLKIYTCGSINGKAFNEELLEFNHQMTSLSVTQYKDSDWINQIVIGLNDSEGQNNLITMGSINTAKEHTNKQVAMREA